MDNQTEFQLYMKNMREFNQIVIDILEKDNILEESFQNLNKYFEDNNIFKDKNKMKLILRTLSSISNNHHRSQNHFSKIEQILKILSNSFKQFFDNNEIFNIFKENKRILLFLFEDKILTPDKEILNIMETDKYDDQNYTDFFLPEFESFHGEEYLKLAGSDYKTEKFLEKRKIGENDDEICSIVRNDSIDEFTEKVANKKYFDMKINNSIFETNPFLCKEGINLLQYSAFYGSQKILKYLMNNEKNDYYLDYSLLSYAVHSNDEEILHLIIEKLEEKDKKKENSKNSQYLSFFGNNLKEKKKLHLNECLLESLKSHHVSFTNYLLEKYFKEENDVKKELPLHCLRFYNFINFDDQMCKNLNDMFCILCEYDYLTLVELFLKSKNLNVNSLYVLNQFFVFNKITINIIKCSFTFLIF